MKIECTQENLAHAVAIADKMAGRKESLPVLSCILFDAKKEGVSLISTNLETGVEVSISCNLKNEGKAAVPSQILSQTVKALPKGNLVVESVGENVRIISKGGSVLLKTIPHDEFPVIPKTTQPKKHRMEKQALIGGLESVLFAVSPSLVRPELASVYVYQDGGSMIFVATDSFRLAEKRVAARLDMEGAELLIPAKNAADLLFALTQAPSDTADVVFEDSQLSVSAGDTFFVSRLVDATFPNYKEIIPSKFGGEVTLLRGDIDASLKRARIFTHTEQIVELETDPKKGLLSVRASHGDVGEMNDDITAAVEGSPIKIRFNLSYLSDALPFVKTDSIFMQFGGENSPLIIRGMGDQSFLYLVMPLNR